MHDSHDSTPPRRDEGNLVLEDQLLNNQLLEVVPALLVTAKQVLPSLKDFNTFGLYALTDATLYGNTLQTDLAIGDAGDVNAILAASRADCGTIGLTFTINPQPIVPKGAMVGAAKLTVLSSL